MALTEDVPFLKRNHQTPKPNNLVEVLDLPSMPNDGGSIALTTANLQVVEHFSYSEDMHLPLINDPDGVSLERLSFDKINK
ncbi:MAG: hypothetical protein U5L96_15845 [Owenweeksia sp.]|nr:hypothetical protein [Owenweeksia sp.]